MRERKKPVVFKITQHILHPDAASLGKLRPRERKVACNRCTPRVSTAPRIVTAIPGGSSEWSNLGFTSWVQGT